jgi:hypothetical protein
MILHGDSAQLVADSASNPFRFIPVGGKVASKQQRHMRFNRPYRTRANADGAYSPLWVIVNRQKYTRTGTELPAMGYDRGILPVERSDSTIEVRIPWGLLNFTDPSSKRVLQDGATLRTEFGTIVVDDIRLVLAVSRDGQWQQTAGSYKLESWEEPGYRARKRPVFDVMRDLFDTLAPTK